MSALLEGARSKLREYGDQPEATGSKVATVATLTVWPELDALPDAATTTPQAFPFHGLGALLGDAARSIANGVQAPDALAGGSVLASAALAAQSHADILMPHGQRAPLSIFVLTGALSGDRKTATDSVASLPAEEHRREQAREHAVELVEFEKGRSTRKKGDPEETPPVARSLTISKATIEGLHMMLRRQSHVGVFTGEGGELLGGVTSVEVPGPIASDAPSSFRAFMRTAPSAAWDEAQTR